jgi:hypothetical protein
MGRLVKVRWIEVCREPLVFYIDAILNTRQLGSVAGFITRTLGGGFRKDLHFNYYRVKKDNVFLTKSNKEGNNNQNNQEPEFYVDILKSSVYIELNKLSNENVDIARPLTDLSDTELKNLRNELLNMNKIEDKYVYIADLTTVIDNDISVKNGVNYKSISDGIFNGFVADVIDMASGITGSQNVLQRMNNMQRYESNDPLRISLELKLYSRYNAILDVLIPTLSLQAASGVRWNNLYKNPKNAVLEVPGLYLSGMGDFSQSIISPTRDQGEGKKSLGSTSRTVYVEIENLIFVADGIMKNVDVVYSNIMTKTGAPLFSEVNLEVETIYPANSIHLFNYITSETALSTLKKRRLRIVRFEEKK